MILKNSLTIIKKKKTDSQLLCKSKERWLILIKLINSAGFEKMLYEATCYGKSMQCEQLYFNKLWDIYQTMFHYIIAK